MAQQESEMVGLSPRGCAGVNDNAAGSTAGSFITRGGAALSDTHRYPSLAGIKAGRLLTPKGRRSQRQAGVTAQQASQLEGL